MTRFNLPTNVYCPQQMRKQWTKDQWITTINGATLSPLRAEGAPNAAIRFQGQGSSVIVDRVRRNKAGIYRRSWTGTLPGNCPGWRFKASPCGCRGKSRGAGKHRSLQ